MKRPPASRLQHPAAWFQNGFHRFLRPYLKRHFHAIAIDRDRREDRRISADSPLVVYANHPSWWDPLVAHFLNRVLFPPRQFFAPIDAAALQQYSVFEKLGFFGVSLSAKSGAAEFLSKSGQVLDQPDTALWVTPEGRFADVRDHEANLQPGLAHLCSRSSSLVALPLALEYVFWDERLPVCLVSLGTPMSAAEHAGDDKADWVRRLEKGLREAQHRLSSLAIERSSDAFDNLLDGKRGAGGAYDSFRRVKSLLTGRSFKASHGEQFE